MVRVPTATPSAVLAMANGGRPRTRTVSVPAMVLLGIVRRWPSKTAFIAAVCKAHPELTRSAVSYAVIGYPCTPNTLRAITGSLRTLRPPIKGA